VILQNTKSESSGFSLMQLLGGSSKEGKSTAFSLLLQQLGIDSKMADAQTGSIDINGLLMDENVMSTESSSKNAKMNVFLNLLQSDDKNSNSLEELVHFEESAEEEIKVLNPKLIQTMPMTSLKQVVAEAKVYLKEQIRELAVNKGIEIDIETLPKTLKSLSLVAEKIGIQLDKITLESIQAKGSILEQSEKKSSILQTQHKPLEHSTEEFVNLRKEKTYNEPLSTAKVLQTSQNSEPLKALLHLRVLDKKELHNEVQKEEKIGKVQMPQQLGEEMKATVQKESSGNLRTATDLQMNTPTATTVAALGNKELKVNPKEEVKLAQTLQEGSLKSSPQEDALTLKPAKSAIENESVVKLSALLHSEEAVTTDAQNATGDSKISVVSAAESKTLSLDVKINEAKQMVSHLATDLKEAMQNYKPPFTRIKLQLNPVKLGEVDVTMVQRGNNVHISVSSNNSAITILAQNSLELKNQLANNGLANATMQFNTSGGEQQRQSQHQQNMMEAYEKYAAFENEENFEILQSLELIVPRYG
jgi:hypothetical protein